MLNLNFNALLAIPAFLVSKGAIITYVLIILASVVVLAMCMMLKESANVNQGVVNAVIQQADGSLLSPQSAKAEEEAEETAERFCMLSEIERNKESYRRAGYDASVTLESLCENLRNYACSRLKLYYDISDIHFTVALTTKECYFLITETKFNSIKGR